MALPPTDLDGADSYGDRQTPAERGDVNLRAGAQMLEYLEIADRMAREVTGPVLDWGCGYGQMTQLMRDRGMDVTAFDWHPDAAPGGETIRLDRYPDVEAHRSSDPVKLPFPDSSFTCVLSCGVLEHVQDPGGSLDELHRVLRPDGRLFVYKLPNRFSYLETLARLMGLYYHGALPHDEVYTRRTAAALVSAHGFRVDAVRLSNLLPLTLTHPLVQRRARPMWAVNRALGSVPGLRLLATNVELDAVAV
jgi:SAM-dependent methyltransferase